MKTLAFWTAGIAVAQVPQLIDYQGRIAVGTVTFSGSRSSKFAVVNRPPSEIIETVVVG